jgi:hypothetical protein
MSLFCPFAAFPDAIEMPETASEIPEMVLKCHSMQAQSISFHPAV